MCTDKAGQVLEQTVMSVVTGPTCCTRDATNPDRTHLDEELSIFSVELLHDGGGTVQLDRKV